MSRDMRRDMRGEAVRAASCRLITEGLYCRAQLFGGLGEVQQPMGMVFAPRIEVYVGASLANAAQTTCGGGSNHQYQTDGTPQTAYEALTWSNGTVESEVPISGPVSRNLMRPALFVPPGGAAFPWRQHASLSAPPFAAVLRHLLRWFCPIHDVRRAWAKATTST